MSLHAQLVSVEHAAPPSHHGINGCFSDQLPGGSESISALGKTAPSGDRVKVCCISSKTPNFVEPRRIRIPEPSFRNEIDGRYVSSKSSIKGIHLWPCLRANSQVVNGSVTSEFFVCQV